MTKGTDNFLVTLNRVCSVVKCSIRKSCNNAILPIEVFACYASSRIFQILWSFVYIWIERHKRIKWVRAVRHPLNCAHCFWHVRADLHNSQLTLTIDADWTEKMTSMLIAKLAVRIVLSALIVRAKHVLNVFNRHFALRLTRPRNIVAIWLVISVFTIPHFVIRIQETLHKPRARSVVHVIGI
ncbi:Uncharacterised protein [Chlamydia trachomatis]|nr:Uncharacterised protein [Chlamydia trachomatis]